MPDPEKSHYTKIPDFRKIADLSPNLLFVSDLYEQRIIYINERVKHLLGIDQEYVYEKGAEFFKIVIHPADYELRLDNYEKCKELEDGEECEVEVRLNTGEKGWQWFRVTEKPYDRDKNGRVSQVISIAQNIHEQKLSEEKLREEHRRFKNAQAIGHIGSFERELPGNAVYCSAEFFIIHGLEPLSRPISIQEFVSYVHPEEQDLLWAAIDQTHKTGEALNMITRIVRPDGSIRHVYRRSALVKNEEGKQVKVYGTVQDITERVEAEEKRKKSEQELLRLKDELAQRAKDRYRKIINSMDEAFCLLEPIFNEDGECVDYLFLDKNPRFEEQTGLQDAVGKRIKELVPKIETYWTELFGRVAKTGESMHLEHLVEGIGRWIEGYAFQVGAPKEKQVAFIFKNITERKKTQERQAFFMKLNDALQPLTEPADIQAVAMKMLGEHLQVNRANYAEVLEDGDTLETGPGYLKKVSALPKQIKLSHFEPMIGESFNRGETLFINDTEKFFGEREEVLAAFKAIEVRAFIGVPGVRNGKLLALVGVHQATPRQWEQEEIKLVEEMCERLWPAVERARIEKALRESEQRFRHLVEASALAVWETNPEGLVETDSPSWRSFTGQSFENWTGEGWVEVVHPEDREQVQKQWKEAVAAERSVDLEYRLRKAGEGYRWMNVKATPIMDTQGNITRWTGMNLDIHDRKQAEEALLKAKEEAEAASRAKEDFVSTMSHEIRTPLNAVIGFTNLLLEQNPRKDQKENLNALSFSAENLLTLINEILDFSKLESGNVKLAENRFNLSELLHSLMKVHHSRALANQTQIELELDEKIPQYVATDQLKLSQVLNNLVSNAVKFTENGLVHITVELAEQEDDVLWLDFYIRDTGIGIPEDKLEYVFEKFTQAEEATLRKYGGTGLGLSITKLLLDVMGSEIKVESKAGEGSEFYFSLPVKMTNNKTPEIENPITKEDVGELGKIQLLLVEDVQINREILIQFLENWWQLQSDQAVNGKEAVEMAEKKDYDLILMDIRMPVMDGYEATRLIRNLPGYKDIPILAVTADKNQQEQQDKDATQFDDLLTKPFKPETLKQRILHHLYVSGKISESGEKEASGESDGELERSNSATQYSEEIEQEEPSFEISRYTKMAGNHKEVVRKWIKSSILAFETYKKEFTTAANENDLQFLSDLIHKNTSSIFYIQANRLAKEIEYFRSLLKETTINYSHLHQQKSIVLKEFDEVITGLKSL